MAGDGGFNASAPLGNAGVDGGYMFLFGSGYFIADNFVLRSGPVGLSEHATGMTREGTYVTGGQFTLSDSATLRAGTLEISPPGQFLVEDHANISVQGSTDILGGVLRLVGDGSWQGGSLLIEDQGLVELRFRAWADLRQDARILDGTVSLNDAAFFDLGGDLEVGTEGTVVGTGKSILRVDEDVRLEGGVLVLKDDSHLASRELLIENGGALRASGQARTSIDGNAQIANGSLSIFDDASLSVAGNLEIAPLGMFEMRNTSFTAVAGNVVNDGLLNLHSRSRLSVRGDFIQHSSARLRLTLQQPAGTPLIHVDGSARLAGTLQIGLDKSFTPKPGTQFEIINAEGGLQGVFDQVALPSSVLFSLNYLEQVVLLEVLKPVDHSGPGYFETIAGTENERAVGSALDKEIEKRDPLVKKVSPSQDLSSILAVVRALPLPQQRGALQAMSPLSYTSLGAISIEAANAQALQLAQRTRSAARALHPDSRADLFVLGGGVFTDLGGRDGIPNGESKSGSALAGAGCRLNTETTVGLFSGFTSTSADLGNNSSAEIETARFGAYLDWTASGFYMSAILAGAYNSYELERSIAFPGLSRNAHGETDGMEFDMMVAGGYDWHIGKFTVGVMADVQGVFWQFDDFAESEAGFLNLAIRNGEQDSFRTHLGAQFSYEWDAPALGFRLVPSARVSWQHEYLDGSDLHASFAQGRGAGFQVIGAKPKRDSVSAGVGVSLLVSDQISLEAFANGDFGGSYANSQSISLSANFQF